MSSHSSLSLLFEEINEIESIYHIINKQLISAYTIPELKELIEAIRAKVTESIKALEWIKQVAIKALEIFLQQKNKKVYKNLYTQIIRNLHTVKYRAMVLSSLTNTIDLYAYLTHNDEYKAPLIALRKTINSAKERLKSSSLGFNLYVLVEYAYSVVDILKEYNIMVLYIPSYDLFKPWKWVLLLHELGHILFDAKRDVFVREFREKIVPLLKQLTPTSISKEQSDAILSLWERYWLEEFMSDLYGIALGSLAYTYAFMIEVFVGNPSEHGGTHPSLDSRIYLQLKYLENIKEVKELTDNVRKSWFSHRENIDATELGYPFPSKALDKLSEVFTDIIKKPAFLNYIDSVIELRERIDKGEYVKADPLCLVLALALSKRGKTEEVQRKVVNAIAGDQ